MDIFGLIIMIIGSLLAIGMFAFLALKVRKLATTIALEAFDLKKEFIVDAILIGLIGMGVMLFFLGIPFYWSTPNQPYEWICIVIGGLFLGTGFALLYTTFRLHYYQKKLSKELDKKLYIILMFCIPILVLSIWVLTEGFANHMTYPLINGISWTNGIHFVDALHGHPNIAWYALCILSGAIYVYFICDHFMYKEFGKHGLLESTFFIAFPAGIIGARIAYVIGNWGVEFGPVFDEDPFKMFRMWEGGLTILGGAITGIIVGVLWFRWRHKDIPIGKTINIIVPTILIAQAVGRWGNFFNAEVHGVEVSGEAWRWLPTFIYNQMQYSSTSGIADPGNIYVPLFFIEAIVNIFGYYFLEFILGKGLKKYVKGFDLAFGYVAWYGATRTFMEPLRDSAFNMGENGRWSWIWSIVFIGAGLLAIIVNHIVRYVIDERKHKNTVNIEKEDNIHLRRIYSLVSFSICLIVSVVLVGVGFALYFNNVIPDGASLISLCPHNIGLILFIVGLCLLPSVVIPTLSLIKYWKAA